MTLTRKELADKISGYDLEMKRLQECKLEAYQDYREQLSKTMGKDAVKAEVDAFKLALKRRRDIAQHGIAAIEDQDALVEEILGEIIGTPIATRVARRARANGATAQEIIEAVTTSAEPEPSLREGAASNVSTDANVDGKVGGGTPAATVDPDQQLETQTSTQPSVDLGTTAAAVEQNGRNSEHCDDAPMVPAGHVVPVNAPAPTTDGSWIAPRSGPIRPYCLDTRLCASPGGRVHCYRCTAARKAGEVAPAHPQPNGTVFGAEERRVEPDG